MASLSSSLRKTVSEWAGSLDQKLSAIHLGECQERQQGWIKRATIVPEVTLKHSPISAGI